MPARHALTRRHALTLVEVLVSLVVTTFVIAAALSVSQDGLRVRNWIAAHKDDQLADRLLDIVAADLRQLASPSETVQTPLRWHSRDQDTVRLEMVTLSSFAPDEALPAGLRKVAYLYGPSRRLLERSEEILPGSGEQPERWREVVTDEIDEFTCSFCDGPRWVKQWPLAGRAASLPRSVHIHLTIRADSRAIQGTRVIVIPAAL